MKVAITGASGQLGRELQRTFLEAGTQFVAKNRVQLDITNAQKISDFLDESRPEWLVNCAAYTKVDQAEFEIEESLRANAEAPHVLAQLCRDKGTKLIHISTDSVFSSEVPAFFSISHRTNPINQYSKSKALGEELVLNHYSDGAWIIRTSWLYGEFGGKFVHTIVDKMKDKEHLQVVNDQFGQPTNTKDLANYIYALILHAPHPGIYHFAGEGYVSRYNFAKQIITNLGGDASRVIGVETVGQKSMAIRPKYSLLELENSSFPSLRYLYNWEDSLVQFTNHMKAVKSVE